MNFGLLAVAVAGLPQLVSRAFGHYRQGDGVASEFCGQERKETTPDAALLYHVIAGLSGLLCRVMVLFVSFLALKWCADYLYTTSFQWH